jgi:PAS domain-containing protein
LRHERVRPNGTALTVHTVPLRGGGAVRTFTDTTAHKQAERREQETAALLRTTLDNMDQGLIMVDADETIRVYNQRVWNSSTCPST